MGHVPAREIDEMLAVYDIDYEEMKDEQELNSI